MQLDIILPGSGEGVKLAGELAQRPWRAGSVDEDQTRYRLAIFGDRDFVARGQGIDQFNQPSLGLSEFDCLHALKTA
jgi:hypothetical protein